MTEIYMPSLKGWRAEVGIVAPYTGLYREWDDLFPEGIKISQVVVGMHGVDSESIRKMTEFVEVEAKKLTFSHTDDLICFACTAGSFIGGRGWDKMLIDKIEKATGIPATTTTTCVLEVFKDMNIKKIALVGPYLKEVFDREVDFLEANGIKVLTTIGLEYSQMPQYWSYYTDPYATYKLMKAGAKAAPNADCIFVTCMLSTIVATVDKAEQEIGKPIISSCSATMYGILKKLGIPDPIHHYGEALVRTRI